MKGLGFKMDENVTTSLIISVQTPCKVLTLKQGTLCYCQNDKNNCVHKNYCNTTVLEKVNTGRCGKGYPAKDEFYPALHSLWLDHVYREYLIYFAYGEQTDSEKGKIWQRKGTLTCLRQERMANLNVIAEGELAAFLAFWLSRFVLPHGKEGRSIYNGYLDGFWQRISLALIVLGYIYYGLGEATSHPNHPGKANTIFPSHYVMELFLSLYRCHLDSDCHGDFPSLVYYAGLLVVNFHYPKLDTFSRMGNIFLSELALIVRTLIMVEMDLLANIARVSQSLSALCSMIDIYKLSTIEICWLSSRIEEIFGIVEIAANIEELVDIDRVKALSDHDLTYSSEITHIEGQLHNLSNEASELNIKDSIFQAIGSGEREGLSQEFDQVCNLL
ncbi:LOW QUALITY PROTEIN: hypothetical protein Cgig2_033551 [Carnegiea gigantea]|uniref:Aminotransferase-like plant mobile domain-containing protein n=1 Tax=Carnegiea gigantea TaxID=171969 RepID=A0A9Q1JU00_9CARY|nr:LOW QUALITY PROTEIN: hypothetical protein Cgig2_033551 [Carnegiea gigantea]